MKKVSGYIERKSMLYRTKVEYGDYTMNHVMGCAWLQISMLRLSHCKALP